MVNIAEMPTHVMEYLGAATFNAVLAYMSTPEGAAQLEAAGCQEKKREEEPA